MANHYHLVERNVNSTPVTGNHLAYAHKSLTTRAFLAADLFFGAKHLTNPTIVQAALLANVNRTYAWWATRRQAERDAIEARLIPLVPPRAKPAPTNGYRTLAKLPIAEIDHVMSDAELVNLARRVGSARMLNAAVIAEAAE